MSIHQCKKIPLSKLIITQDGVLEPLCNSCKNKTCEMPIEKKIISVMGINKEMRIYVSGRNVYMVVGCDGHVV